MNTKWVLAIALIVLLGVGLLAAAFWAGWSLRPAVAGWPAEAPAAGWMMPWGPGVGMMGRGWQSGPMMGGALGRSPAGRATSDPLTFDEAEQAAEAFLQAQELDDLEVGEIMIFDNHAYVVAVDASTGQGAIELLVDPTTRQAFLEFGPSMMWNSEYGMMGAAGAWMPHRMLGGRGAWMHGGMMGGWGSGMGRWAPSAPADLDSADLPVTPERAVELAQAFLDRTGARLAADDHALAFPGYYTLHTLRDGEVIGMLSVNASTGQVWLHAWHGRLLDVREGAH